MPGCMLSATKASLSSVEKRRLRATPVITSTFENVSDIGIRLGLSLGPPAKAGVRSKRGAVQIGRRSLEFQAGDYSGPDLFGARIPRADLRAANLKRAGLVQANLSGADLC